MNFIKVTRAAEWWDYKFPPMLVVIYLIAAQTNEPIESILYVVVFIILALTMGAVYVSLLNDLTDIEEDRLAGKKNRMVGFSKPIRLLLIFISLSPILLFAFLLQKNVIALTFYLLSYLAFTLYSTPPFRLKEKGLFGIFADASGSQFFPTLFVTFYVAQELHFSLSGLQIIAISVWALCFGLRGILWHQFHDLKNDIKSGLNTWVRKLSESDTKWLSFLLITIEFVAISVIAFNSRIGGIYIALLLYFVYLVMHIKLNHVELIVLRYTNNNYTIFLNEFYQVFLPFFLLIYVGIDRAHGYYLLFLHLILFPLGYFRVLKVLHMFKYDERKNFSK